jgi:hypothetical protein
MGTDRILQPEQIAGIIRAYLEGEVDGLEAAHRALLLAGSTDRILAGHQTRCVAAGYWALRRLAETGAGRPDGDEMKFLLDCIEGRRRFPQPE